MAHHGTDDPAEKFVTRLLVHHFPSHLCYLSGSVFHPPSKHSENPFLHLQADVLQELLILLQSLAFHLLGTEGSLQNRAFSLQNLLLSPQGLSLQSVWIWASSVVVLVSETSALREALLKVDVGGLQEICLPTKYKLSSRELLNFCRGIFHHHLDISESLLQSGDFQPLSLDGHIQINKCKWSVCIS